MAAWDDVIDFDNVSDWPIDLSEWLRLLRSSTDEGQRSQIVQHIRRCLQGARIRTYHCTRLLPSEVESIKANGLQPSSPELARHKREAAQNAGWPFPFWAQEDPSGKIWFYHRRPDLDAAIAGPLLRSWGGKQLLASSRGVVDLAAKPYIIALNYPAAELKYVFGNHWCALETKIINQYLAQSSPATPELQHLKAASRNRCGSKQATSFLRKMRSSVVSPTIGTMCIFTSPKQASPFPGKLWGD
jgi:hypothetical protein